VQKSCTPVSLAVRLVPSDMTGNKRKRQSVINTDFRPIPFDFRLFIFFNLSINFFPLLFIYRLNITYDNIIKDNPLYGWTIYFVFIRYVAAIAVRPPAIVEILGTSPKNTQLKITALDGTKKTNELAL